MHQRFHGVHMTTFGTCSPLDNFLKGAHAERNYWRMLQIARWTKGPRVLDVGCGHGSVARFLDDKDIESYTGVDISDKHLAFATNKYGKTRDWVTFQRDWPSGRFNTIVLAEVLEHQEKPINLLKQAEDNLAENGVICITIPHGPDEVTDHRHVFYTHTFLDLVYQTSLSIKYWEYRQGHIFCVLSNDGWADADVDFNKGEENIGYEIEWWIKQYRILERHYELTTVRGIVKRIQKLLGR